MAESSRSYIPAAGHDWYLPLYDPMVKLMGGEAARRALLDLADVRPGHRVLDIGCGTGSLAVLIKRLRPDTDVIGIDPDPKALSRARRKAERAAVSIRFDRGFGDELPYSDASMDRVFSSFMFHHLERKDKQGMLAEVRRVLKPGGIFTLLDLAGPDSGKHGLLVRLFHSSHHLKDNSDEQILALMREAGLADARKVSQSSMMLGLARINYYQAGKV
ncbi:MAG TPA: class I SAM-dependent methyltransferase [Blastocatellia bacterium]|nr:class I SAM-dependent methyltransferase [Blastocatellia bacterium]